MSSCKNSGEQLNQSVPYTKVFWLFGRSGAGKTTLGKHLLNGLLNRSIPTIYLDGDDLRATLCSDLGFRPEDRAENHRRIAEVARTIGAQGLNVVVSTMAPEYQQRDLVSKILGKKLVWFYIHAPLNVCIARDPKGIYKKAQQGQISQLIDYPFDAPRPQERVNTVDTTTQGVEGCFESLLEGAKASLSDFSI